MFQEFFGKTFKSEKKTTATSYQVSYTVFISLACADDMLSLRQINVAIYNTFFSDFY